MPKDVRYELRGKKNEDGTFDAAVCDENGNQFSDPGFVLVGVDADAIPHLYVRATERYGMTLEIHQSLIECFPPSFFEADKLP